MPFYKVLQVDKEPKYIESAPHDCENLLTIFKINSYNIEMSNQKLIIM